MLLGARKVHDFLERPDIRKVDTKLVRQNQLAHGVRLKAVDIESFRDQSLGAVNNWILLKLALDFIPRIDTICARNKRELRQLQQK